MSLELFERSFCECQHCSWQCRCFPGTCGPGDVERILKSLGCDPADIDDVATYFMADVDEPTMLPVIRPKQRENGHCVFEDEGRCLVYRNRPYGCSRALPCKQEIIPAMQAVAEAVAVNDDYQRMHEELLREGDPPPIPEERIVWTAEMFGIIPKESEENHD